jgi:tetratricopeptide (TPR) repeat protein
LPVEAFVRPPSRPQPETADARVGELERLCDTGRHGEAIALAGQLIQEGGTPLDVCAAAYYATGHALYQLARPKEALGHFQRSRRLAEAGGDAWLAARSMAWEASVHHVTDDPRAVATGEEALRRYRRLEDRDPDVEAWMLERLGTFLTRRHTFVRARACYEEALHVAGPMRDLVRLARIYQGLSACHWSLGSRQRAIELAQRAVTLFAVESELRPVAAKMGLPRAENDLGVMLMRQGQHDRAEACFLSALDHLEAAGGERIRSHFLLSLSELRQRQGRPAEAVELVREAMDLAERLGETMALATGLQQLGQLHAERGERERAVASFERALDILDAAGLSERRAECLAAYENVKKGDMYGTEHG